MDRTELTWYTRPMPRGPKPKPKELHLVNVGLKVEPNVKKELLEMVGAESRTEGDLARLLFMRGLEAYRHDRSLFGPAIIGVASVPTFKANQNDAERERAEKSGNRVRKGAGGRAVRGGARG